MELPPVEFSNRMNELIAEGVLDAFDFTTWRQSIEWRCFVGGYNAAVKKVNSEIQSQYNMGESASRIFGPGE